MQQHEDGSLTSYETLLTGVDRPMWGTGSTWQYNTTAPVTYALTANTDGTPQSLVAFQGTSLSPQYLVNRQYSQDYNGNLTASVDNVIGPSTSLGTTRVPSETVGFRTDQYTYDFANRLTSDSNSLGTQSYALDQVGRITGTSFTSGTQAVALGMPSETATSSSTYDSNGRPSAANQTDVQDGTTDDEQDMPTITTDASGNTTGVTENGGEITETFAPDQSQHLSTYSIDISEEGTFSITHQADSQYRQTLESVSYAPPEETSSPLGYLLFYYGAGGEILSLDSQNSDCLGQTQDVDGNPVTDERLDLIYLYGLPVAMLFSTSNAVAQPDCGLNYVIPNHLGAPLRLIDSSGNTAQSPEVGPYDGLEQTGWNHTNGPRFNDILARFDTSNNLVPLGGLGSYSSLMCSGGDCPANTYSQTITEPGATGFQLNLDITGIDPCSDTIQVSGSSDAANSVPTESVPASTTGSYATFTHYGDVMVSLLSDTTRCGGICTCNTPEPGGAGFQITSANVQYSSATESQLGVALPGMYDDQGFNVLNNWNRYFVEDMQAYTQPDPMMSNPKYMQALMREGLWNPAYGYASANPLMFIDPTGLWGGYAFGAVGIESPGPVRGGAEGVALGGWDSNSGFYAGDIAVTGVSVGGESNYVSHYSGTEFTTDNPNGTTISINEGSLGGEIPFLAGVSLGAGWYTTSDGDWGVFGFGHGGVLGASAALGGGFSGGGGGNGGGGNGGGGNSGGGNSGGCN